MGLRGETEKLVTVAKIGTGLSDEQWRELKRRLDNEVRVEPPVDYVVEKSLAPDVWVDPMVIVEIAADEVTKSPIHSAGYALRFPRFLRWREKKPEQATTTKEILKLI